MERVLDPEFQASVRGYASEAATRASQVGLSANEWGKHQLGVDVAGQVGGVLGGGNQSHEGYGQLSQDHDGGPSPSFYQDDDDFFESMGGGPARASEPPMRGVAGSSGPGSTAVPATKKADDWDEWKDF